MKTQYPILEFNGYHCILEDSQYNDRLWGKIYTSDNSSFSLGGWRFAADTIEEAQKKFEIQVEKIIKHKQYFQQSEDWKNSTDIKSILCVFNIQPDIFKERIQTNRFDTTLLNSVKGGDYEVPLYYVTKAWDIILKGSLFPIDFMIGPEEEDDCTEEKVQSYLEDENATRSRCEACQDNDKMKVLWKEHFNVDIDNLQVDFLKFNMHLPPNVSRNEYEEHFMDVLGGIDEWILGGINYPESDIISHDYVSSLMEFTAEVLLRREGKI